MIPFFFQKMRTVPVCAGAVFFVLLCLQFFEFSVEYCNDFLNP